MIIPLNEAVIDSVPCCYRVVSLTRLPAKQGRGIYNEAQLYHDNGHCRVSWHSNTVDVRIKRGSLVAIRGCEAPWISGDQPRFIKRLDLLDKPVPAINLFQTIPESWYRERAVTEKAAALWERVDRPMRHLLNAVLWDGGRFMRYIASPRGTLDRAWMPGLNFRDAVTNAEQAMLLSQGIDDVSTSVVIVAALLQTVGKADAFVRDGAAFQLSERGARIGYELTVLEWLGAARRHVIISEPDYLALVHAIIAMSRETVAPKSMEASILCAARELSTHSQM